MKRILIFAVLTFSFTNCLHAQNMVTLSAGIPLGGSYGKEYSLFVGIDYDRVLASFGNPVEKDKTSYKPFTVNLETGVDYYFGKDIGMGQYTFKVDNLPIAHVYPEIDYHPCSRGSINLGAGPAVGFWPGTTEFGYGVSLVGVLQVVPKKSETSSGKKPISVEAGVQGYSFGGDAFWSVNVGLELRF